MNEALLNTIIHDTQSKGSSVIGWEYSSHQHVVLLYSNELPKYFMNIACAIDSLIHQYNLRTKYKHLYETTVKSVCKDRSIKSKSSYDSSIDKAIKACDVLLLNNNDLVIGSHHKIYEAIHKAYRGKTFSYNEFIAVRSSLIDHYAEQHDFADSRHKKDHLRHVVRLFEEMTFSDISMLMD